MLSSTTARLERERSTRDPTTPDVCMSRVRPELNSMVSTTYFCLHISLIYGCLCAGPSPQHMMWHGATSWR